MAPKITSSASITYNHKSMSFTLNQSHKGEYYFSDSHNFKSEDYALTNISISKILDEFKISVWAKNIFDQKYAVRGFYFGLIPPNYEDQLWVSYGDPAQYGVSLDYNFNDSF